MEIRTKINTGYGKGRRPPQPGCQHKQIEIHQQNVRWLMRLPVFQHQIPFLERTGRHRRPVYGFNVFLRNGHKLDVFDTRFGFEQGLKLLPERLLGNDDQLTFGAVLHPIGDQMRQVISMVAVDDRIKKQDFLRSVHLCNTLVNLKCLTRRFFQRKELPPLVSFPDQGLAQ